MRTINHKVVITDFSDLVALVECRDHWALGNRRPSLAIRID